MAGDNRKEPRYPTHDSVDVYLLPRTERRIRAQVLDISLSGLQLELSTSIPVGAKVEVFAQGQFAALGEVRYCRGSGDFFYAGMQIQSAILPAAVAARHMTDEQVSMYSAGRGFSASEFIHATKHVADCAACRERVEQRPEGKRLDAAV